MKKFSAVVIALIVLCLSLVPMTASAADEKPLWITHFNENTVEGAGTIFVSEYSGAAWWIHFAFAPTSVENVYTITGISNGIADGSASPLAIPEGGFVYALNVGNDYATINNNPNDINYTSANCSNVISDVGTNWMVGMNIKFNGVDLENLTVPTTTPDVKWYDDSYVCTATYSVYEGEVSAPEESSSASSSESSADESAATSEPAGESSAAVSEASEPAAESSAASFAANSPAAKDEGGLGAWLWVIIIAVIAVIAAVVVAVVKKKK